MLVWSIVPSALSNISMLLILLDVRDGSHNLGFFLGPGRARSRIMVLGLMDGGALFRLLSTLTGAVAEASTLGTGVAFASDFVSADAGDGCCVGGCAAVGAASSLGVTTGVDGKRANFVDGSEMVTTRLFFALLLGVDDIVVVV